MFTNATRPHALSLLRTICVFELNVNFWLGLSVQFVNDRLLPFVPSPESRHSSVPLSLACPPVAFESSCH
jgi:hypothetical protein